MLTCVYAYGRFSIRIRMIRPGSSNSISDKETLMKSLGQTLAECRKERRYKQADVTKQLKKSFGMDVSVNSLSHWEKDVATPSARQLFALCEIYKIANINETFGVYIGHTPISRLNIEGREKVYEYAQLLVKSGLYEKKKEEVIPVKRLLKLFHLRASCGTGQYMDSDSYDEIEVEDEVPAAADFGVTLTGNSMEPVFIQGQTVWVHSQEALNNGEIGVFYYNEEAYCKKYTEKDGKVVLVSLNPSYVPIVVDPENGFKIFGKVLG